MAMASYAYDTNGGKESRNQQATVWIGGLEPQTTEELVWELMLQAGPVVSVNLPRDKITQTHQGFAFCEFIDADTADYACRLMNNIKLYGKQLRINKAATDNKDQPDQAWSANLFIGNLDAEVDEKMLYDTFSAFGAVMSAKVGPPSFEICVFANNTQSRSNHTHTHARHARSTRNTQITQHTDHDGSGHGRAAWFCLYCV
jgi:RNA recognition motif-containing protein